MNESAGMPGMRLPGLTVMAPFSSALEFCGENAVNIERNVASMRL